MQSTFMAKIDAKDKMGTKISTNSICYQTVWSHWLYCTSLTLGFKSGSLPRWWENQLKFALLLLISKGQFYGFAIHMNHSNTHTHRTKKTETSHFACSSQFHGWEKTQDGYLSKDMESENHLSWKGPQKSSSPTPKKRKHPKEAAEQTVSKVNIQMKRLLLWQDIQDIRNFMYFGLLFDCEQNVKCTKITLSQLNTIPY